MPTKTSAIRSVSVVSGCRAPRGRAVPGQRDVDPLLGQHAGVALGLELGQPGVVGLLTACAGRVHPLAGVAPGGGRQRAELAAGQQHRRAVAEVGRADGGQRLEVRRLRERLLARRSPPRRGPPGRARRPAWGRRDRWRQTREAILPGRPARAAPGLPVRRRRPGLRSPAALPPTAGMSGPGATTGCGCRPAPERGGGRRGGRCWRSARPSSTARRTSSAAWPAGGRRCSASSPSPSSPGWSRWSPLLPWLGGPGDRRRPRLGRGGRRRRAPPAWSSSSAPWPAGS